MTAPPSTPQPILRTSRLTLRPFVLADAERVSELAGDREVAATTLRIPHPYEAWMAEEWIAYHRMAWDDGTLANFAVTTTEDGLIGSIGLSLHRDHARGEMGYWIGKPYWGRGFVTEAAAEILRFGFGELGLHRIHAHHMTGNPASGTVLRKLGMRHEGTLRHHTLKWGKFHDIECYGLLADEYAPHG
ncbi:MAG: GNAT family N-acetyltransferase [Gemmatimonadales bacterium]